VHDVFAARRLLEAEMVRLAVPRLAPHHLDALKEAIAMERHAAASGDLDAERHADQEFHRILWRACGNDVLHDLMGSVWRRVLQARSYRHRAPRWSDHAIAGHERILAAAWRRDAAAAVTATVAAIDAAEAEILTYLPLDSDTLAVAGGSSPAVAGPTTGAHHQNG
jgi:DNA-binding GntR family transcriptional regulator